MLIVAIPKSASSSLLETVGARHNLPRDQLLHLDLARPKDLEVLPDYHSDVGELTPSLVSELVAPGVVYKQHVPPTDTNRALLRGHRYVVLLRQPEQIVSAYWRADQRAIHPPRPAFADAHSEQEWHECAAENGLLRDLRRFRDGWLAEQREGADALVLDFDQILDEPDRAIRRVERHLGLPPVRSPVRLAKRRYSRGVVPVLLTPCRRAQRAWTRSLRRRRR